MWYLISLLLSSFVDCANHCSENYFLQGRVGSAEDEFMEPRGRWPEKKKCGHHWSKCIKYSKSLVMYHGVLLEAEWEENYCLPQAERLVPIYHRANVMF